MRYRLLLFAVFLLGCSQNNNDKKDVTIKKDSVISTPAKDTIVNKEATLMEVSNSILLCLQKKDFTCLAGYVHPGSGVRFSPYAHIDTVNDKLFSKDKLLGLSKNKKKINWGSYDAREDKIIMDPDAYLEKFVYDVDFINAKKKTINISNAKGNMINNLEAVYPSASFTEFYFPEFDPKFDGMDWRALRLVFKKERGRFYLIGIIHDQWTI